MYLVTLNEKWLEKGTGDSETGIELLHEVSTFISAAEVDVKLINGFEHFESNDNNWIRGIWYL